AHLPHRLRYGLDRAIGIRGDLGRAGVDGHAQHERIGIGRGVRGLWSDLGVLRGTRVPKVKRSMTPVRLFAITMLLATAANACPVCFGGPNSIGKGMDAAILFLLSMVGLVQLGIVALFISFWRRARALRRRKESFHLIEGGAR